MVRHAASPRAHEHQLIETSRSTQAPDRPDTPDVVTLAEREAAQKVRRTKALWICVHMSMNVGAMLTVLASRPLMLRMLLGRPDKVAQLMAYVTSMVGVTEFVLNPIAGHLSDLIGRKVKIPLVLACTLLFALSGMSWPQSFLLQSPAVSMVMKLLVYFNPTVTTIVMERVLCGACTAIGGSTTTQTVLADLIDDPVELGQAYSLLGSAAGIGVMCGPIVGAMCANEESPVQAYLAGAGLSALQMVWSYYMIEETLELPPINNKPGAGKHGSGIDHESVSIASVLAKVNPFAMIKLFTGTPKLALLAAMSALQCSCEGKAISDLKSYYFMNHIPHFTLTTRSLYQTFWGAVMACSGVCGKESIRRLGMHGHTTLQNSVTCLVFALVARASSANEIFATLPFYLFSMERRAAVSSWAIKEAALNGMGKGEYAAAFFNLRALAVATFPLVYVSAYSSGVKAVPQAAWRPWALAISFCAVAEALHQNLRFRDE